MTRSTTKPVATGNFDSAASRAPGVYEADAQARHTHRDGSAVSVLMGVFNSNVGLVTHADAAPGGALSMHSLSQVVQVSGVNTGTEGALNTHSHFRVGNQSIYQNSDGSPSVLLLNGAVSSIESAYMTGREGLTTLFRTTATGTFHAHGLIDPSHSPPIPMPNVTVASMAAVVTAPPSQLPSFPALLSDASQEWSVATQERFYQTYQANGVDRHGLNVERRGVYWGDRRGLLLPNRFSCDWQGRYTEVTSHRGFYSTTDPVAAAARPRLLDGVIPTYSTAGARHVAEQANDMEYIPIFGFNYAEAFGGVTVERGTRTQTDAFDVDTGIMSTSVSSQGTMEAELQQRMTASVYSLFHRRRTDTVTNVSASGASGS